MSPSSTNERNQLPVTRWQLEYIEQLVDELPARHLDWLLESRGRYLDNITWWTQDRGKADSLIGTLETLVEQG